MDTQEYRDILAALGYPNHPYNGVCVFHGPIPSQAIQTAVALIPVNIVTANLNNVSGLSVALSSAEKAKLNQYQREAVKAARKAYTGTGAGSLEEMMEAIGDCLEAGNPVNPAHMTVWLGDRAAVKAAIPLPPLLV